MWDTCLDNMDANGEASTQEPAVTMRSLHTETANDVPLTYRSNTDSWTGRRQGHELEVSGVQFARRLNELATRWFQTCWDELGEEEYIHVLAATEHDLEFWGALFVRPTPLGWR